MLQEFAIVIATRGVTTHITRVDALVTITRSDTYYKLVKHLVNDTFLNNKSENIMSPITNSDKIYTYISLKISTNNLCNGCNGCITRVGTRVVMDQCFM